MNPKLLGSLLVGIIALTGVYIGTLSLNQQPISQNIINDQQAQVSGALPSGLIAHLPFDDSSLADASGNGRDGSWSGTSSFGTGKIGNGSASFGGSNYVSINDQVYPLSGGTVAFWFKSNGGILTGSYGGSNNQRAPTLSVTATGNLKWEYGGSFGSTDTGIKVADGVWHHVALTYSSSNQVRVYLDGKQIVITNSPAPGDFFDQVHIGHYGNYGSSFGNGQVDDFRIYNKVLSSSDISTLFSYSGETSTPGDSTAPSISNVSASGVTENQATISWTTNEASDSYVEYGVTSTYTSNTTLDTSKVTAHSQAISGLSANTVYNYRVVSKDAAGNSATSANNTFTTKAAADTVKPSVPSGLTASDITKSSARVSWSASTDNVGVVGYKVYRNGSEINSVAKNVYPDSGLSANTAYSYTIAAYDAAGNTSAQSTALSVKTLQDAPTVSLSANPTSVTSGQASTLSWTSTNATSCTATGGTFSGTKAVTGSQSVSTITTTQTNAVYSISCTGPGGSSSSSSVTIAVAPAPVVTSSMFKIGDKIQTLNISNVRGSGALSSTLIGTQYTGSVATVVDDQNVPEGIKNPNDGYFWWKLDFETGVDGYVGQDNIKAAVLSTNFKVGDKIQTTEQTNVRTIGALNGTLVGSRVLGSTGTIIGGGAQNPVDGFYWWKIDYDNTTVDGYSGQGTLKLTSTNQPTPFTVTTAKAGTGSGTVSCNPSTCTANTGSTVVVNGSAASGSTLVGFTVSPTSAGTCTTTSCTLTAAGTVTATFNLNPVTGVDTTKPSVTTFTVPSTSSSLTVTASIVASDNVGVTGYLITESATAPSVTASGWTLASPTSYTFASAGAKTLYAWAKDLAGNVSLSRSASVTVTIAAAKFTIPQSVIPNGDVNVRQTAAGTLLGTQSTTVSGTTLAGPVTATLNGTSYQWWNINFASGVDGWVGQDGLDAYTPPTSGTPFTVTTAKAGTGSGTVSCNPSTCTANTGSTVVVNGSAASGSTLVGFTVSPTSAGTCTTTSCTLTAAGTVTATFNLNPVTGVNTYYVTPTGAGTMNGTSWANAFAGITSVAWSNLPTNATVYVGAGTYPGFTVGKGQVTIKAAQDTNIGLATFTGSVSYGGQSNVAIDGGYAGTNNFKFNTFTNLQNATNPVLKYVNASQVDARFTTGGEYAYLSITLDAGSEWAVNGEGSKNASAYDQTIIRDSVIRVPGQINNGTGADGIKPGRGWTVKNNNLSAFLGTVSNAEHQDLIQIYGNGYIKIVGNTFTDSGDAQLGIDHGSPSNIQIFNNVFRRTIANMGTVMFRTYTSNGAISSFTNFSLENNTFVDGSRTGNTYGAAVRVHALASSMNITNSYIRNNLIYNSGNGWPAFLWEGPTSGGWVSSNNIVASGAAGNTSVSSFPGFTVATPQFVGYTAYSAASGAAQLGLSSADTAALNKGTAISTFSTDRDNIARPQGNAWDIGAYEFSGTTQPPISNSTKFIVGDKVAATDILYVRDAGSTGATSLGTQALGNLGTIVGGGTSSNGYYWWNVNYDTGVDGWSVENYLVKYTPPTQTTFTVTTAKAGTGSGTVSCNPSTCSIAQGSTVLVSATAASGSSLAGVTVSPSSAGSCTVNSCALTAAGTVTATFNANPVTGTGGNWYLNASVGTSGNGTSWSSAWKNTSNIVWSSIQPGDTLWIAGGSYGALAVAKSGTAAKPIYIKRVLSTDAIPTAAAGWSSSLDSRATFTSYDALSAPVSYVEIDGRVDMGLRFVLADTSSGGLPSSYNATGGNYITLNSVDLVGPNAFARPDGSSTSNPLVNHAGDTSGVKIGYGYSPNPGADNITIKNSRVRGHANEFWFAGARNITIENNEIYDNGAANSAQWHGNLMIVNGSNGIIFRNNDVYNWQVEGLYPWGSASKNWYVYGNVFHDGIGGKSGSTHRFLELRSYSGTVTHGPFYVYNNTVANAYAAFTRGDTTVYWSADSVARNNLVYNVAGGGVGYLPAQASNNLYYSSTADIFKSATDYSLKAGIAGVSAPNVTTVLKKPDGTSIVTDFEKDPTGKTRGADGVWDVGAYEF